MKKLLSIIAFISLFTIAYSPLHAQIWNGAGNKVSFAYPPGLTGKNVYTFPSFQKDTVKSADTISVTMHALETWIKVDTMKLHQNILVITPGSILAGAKVYLQASTFDSVRPLYINQGTTRLDTLSVSSSNSKRLYVYDGTALQRIP